MHRRERADWCDGPRHQTWLQERIDGRLAAGVAIAWFVLLQVAMALEPVTHEPEPSYGIALELVMWLLLATTVAGLVMQRRWGLVSSLGAAGLPHRALGRVPGVGPPPVRRVVVRPDGLRAGARRHRVVAIRWSGALPESLARFGDRTPAEHTSDVDLVDADHTT